MEVFVRNLHDQMTEKQVDNFFRPVLDNLGIKIYHCQKLQGKSFATLTFLDKTKGHRFLHLHGQTKPGPQGFVACQRKLLHIGRPVNCSLSNKEPDEYLLKALKKEESDRYAKSQSKKPTIVPGKLEVQASSAPDHAFGITVIQCGQWTYVRDELAFATYCTERRVGRIVFGSRCLLIRLQLQCLTGFNHQIEIPYRSIESFTIGSKSTSITFSLSEAPKMYEELADDITRTFQKFNMGRVQPTFKRKRISAISEAHEKVAASCLCYRLLLAKASDIGLMQNLKRFSEIPRSIIWDTVTVSNTPFPAQMTTLYDALTGTEYSALPFDIKFQVQKLAQNGYLAPSRVVEFMPHIAKHIAQMNATSMASSLRYLAARIPFAGPTVEASDFSVQALTDTLLDSQELNIEEDPYSVHLAEQHDHMTMVHKAMVTPVGVYLYGPELEIKNRVLRKYSAYPTHFLSVSFYDEDGEQLRFDRQTDSAEIFHGRFKKVLEGVINIAGRGYEVRKLLFCFEYTQFSLFLTVPWVFSFFPSCTNMLVYGALHH